MHYSFGDYVESDRALTDAVESAIGEEAEIAFFLRALGRGHNPAAGETLASLTAEVENRLAALGDASPLAYAEGYHTLGRLYFWSGDTTGQLEAGTQARDCARRAGVTSLEALASAVMGSGLMYGASPWGEYEEFARALLGERDRLGRIAENALSGLAIAAAAQCRFEESFDLYAQYEASLLERGDEGFARTAGQNHGWAYYLAGDVETAERLWRRTWIALGEAGERGYRSTVGCLLGLALLELDRREEAESIVDEAEGMGAPDDWLTEAMVELMRARFLSEDGRHDDAVARGERLAGLSEQGYFLLQPWFLIESGRVLAAAGHADAARATLDDAIRRARVKGSLVYEQHAQAVLDAIAGST